VNLANELYKITFYKFLVKAFFANAFDGDTLNDLTTHLQHTCFYFCGLILLLSLLICWACIWKES